MSQAAIGGSIMDIEAIKLFVVSVEMLNISAAGRSLGVSPAVASARLSKLERQLGADLFHRSTRKVVLSIEGAEFLPYAKEILEQESAARVALGLMSDEVKGTLRFASSSTFAQTYIAPIIPEFLERYPLVNIEFKLSDMQLDLIEGGFDLALRNYAIADSNLRARRLAEDQRILCASPTYLFHRGEPNFPEDLGDHELLVFRDQTARKLYSANGAHTASSFPPPGVKARIVCDDGATMKQMTIAGVGISMNTYWNVHQELKNGSLIRVLPEFEILDESAIWLVYPKSNVLTAKVRVFIDFLLEKLTPLDVWREP